MKAHSSVRDGRQPDRCSCMLHSVQSESPRLLSFIDWTACPDSLDEARFDSLRRFMLVAMLAHSMVLLRDAGDLGWAARWVLSPLFLTSALVGLSVRRAISVCLMLTFATTSFWLVLAWPNFANHLFLEWSVLLFSDAVP